MKFPSVFTATQNEILEDLKRRGHHERQHGIREALSLKALDPSVAQLLYLLILQQGARTIVEFGTSHGYSTIHLAAAAEQTDGQVHSVDLMPEKTAFATGNLEAAGLMHRVTLATSDGVDFVTSLPHGVDFVLVDYGVPRFAAAFPELRKRTKPGCLMFFDGGPGGYWDREDVGDFKTLLEEDPSFMVTMLPMHKEQLLAVRIGE